MWGEDRSVTFNINDSILAICLRTFFAFMIAPSSSNAALSPGDLID